MKESTMDFTPIAKLAESYEEVANALDELAKSVEIDPGATKDYEELGRLLSNYVGTSLTRIQNEIKEWTKQFGDNVSHNRQAIHFGQVLGSIPAFFGIVSELGELANEDVYAMQGRDKLSPQERYRKRRDAVADLLIFLCDYCNREDINLLEALQETWETVSKRRKDTWMEDKAGEEATAPPVIPPGEAVSANHVSLALDSGWVIVFAILPDSPTDIGGKRHEAVLANPSNLPIAYDQTELVQIFSPRFSGMIWTPRWLPNWLKANTPQTVSGQTTQGWSEPPDYSAEEPNEVPTPLPPTN